jgi:putative membrane protein
MLPRTVIVVVAGLGLGPLLGCHHEAPGDDTADDFHPAWDMPREEAANPAAIQDQDFLIQAAQANHAEIELGRLAERKTTNADVRSFGRHMIEDHSASMDELSKLAQKKGIQLPSGPDDAHVRDAERLTGTIGAVFDRMYVRMMVDDHVKAVALFKKAMDDAADSDVRAWAQATLPKLREHLKMARDLDAKIGGHGAPD